MLRLSGITKNYGERRALDGVTFDVAPGRLTGFVGGNGAGKTTTMRIVLGLLTRTTRAPFRLDGRNITEEGRRSFGYMPEERGLYPKMKVLDHIVYLARLHGFDRQAATERSTALLEQLGLGERLGDNVEALSLGNQQRAQIAAALVHDPDVLILDEPFSGLDPLAVEVVAGVLQDRAAQGTSVLFSSHQLDVVERLCDDLVIIAERARSAPPAAATTCALSTPPAVSSGRRGTTSAGCVRPRASRSIDFDGGYALFDADDAEAAQRVLQHAVSRRRRRRDSPRSSRPSPRSSRRSSSEHRSEHPAQAQDLGRSGHLARRRARHRLAPAQQGVPRVHADPRAARRRRHHLDGRGRLDLLRHAGRRHERRGRRARGRRPARRHRGRGQGGGGGPRARRGGRRPCAPRRRRTDRRRGDRPRRGAGGRDSPARQSNRR